MNEKIKLPEVCKDVKMTLFDALQNRESSRNFAKRDLENDILSRLLWAADGINRPEIGKCTAPSAMDRHSVSIYVCRKDGAWLWNREENTLEKVCDKDLGEAVRNGQPTLEYVPVALVLVSDNGKFDENATEAPLTVGALDVALICQNINLACTALGLANVPRLFMDVPALKKELGLSATQFPIMNNVVGYPG